MLKKIRSQDNGIFKIAFFGIAMILSMPEQCKRTDKTQITAIHLNYLYPSNKIPPEIIFFEKHYDTTNLFYYEAFPISSNELHKIEQSALAFDSIGLKTSDLNINGYFNITIYYRDSVIRYTIDDRLNTNRFLDLLPASIEDDGIRKRVANSLQLIKNSMRDRIKK